MKFGIHNPSFVFGPDPAEAFDHLKAKALWAKSHGFAWFSVMDHLIQIAHVGAPDEPFIEGWTALSALAAVTGRIRLATLVSSVAFRNPAHLAKISAGVDLISRGRMTLGIGAGWFEEEYRQYGWTFPPRPATRIRQLEEAVRLIVAMWTQPRTTFDGRYFHAKDAILEPKPVQKPRPPIMVAGGGEQLTLRVVARLADACNVGGDPAMVRHKFAVLRAHCEAEGRDYATIERTNITGLLIARDEASLAAKRERLGGGPFLGVAGTVAQITDLIGAYRTRACSSSSAARSGTIPRRSNGWRRISCRGSVASDQEYRTSANDHDWVSEIAAGSFPGDRARQESHHGGNAEGTKQHGGQKNSHELGGPSCPPRFLRVKSLALSLRSLMLVRYGHGRGARHRQQARHFVIGADPARGAGDDRDPARPECQMCAHRALPSQTRRTFPSAISSRI